MKNRFFLLLLCAYFAFSLSSCTKDEEEIKYENIRANQATAIGFNGFEANWNIVENSEFYELELSTDQNFSTLENTVKIDDNTTSSFEFRDLTPDITYYYRIRYFVNDISSEYSNVIVVKLNRERKNISFLSHDNITLKGTLYKQIQITGKVPAVIFVHESNSDRSEWVKQEFFKRFVDSGFVSLAFDVTGHGESGGVIDFNAFRNDKEILPVDFQSSIDYLKSLGYIDENKIGAYGGSMGAFMVAGATSMPEIQSVVALTCPLQHIINLYETDNINSVFYISGELDGTFPEDAQLLYNLTKDPKKIRIVEGTAKHGVHLLKASEELKEEAFDWVYNKLK